MDWSWALATTLPLIGGWIWKVEQRLMRLADIEADVKETRADVKDIYQYLIGRRPNDQIYDLTKR